MSRIIELRIITDLQININDLSVNMCAKGLKLRFLIKHILFTYFSKLLKLEQLLCNKFTTYNIQIESELCCVLVMRSIIYLCILFFIY